jgi:urease accessory protein
MSESAQPQLDLCFETRAGRTVLAQRHVSYPFFVTAPLRGRGDGAEVIIQSVSGGLFGDDRIAQRVTVHDGGEAVIRMPSATVVHGCRGKSAASQTVTLRAGDGVTLLYLPRPVILLPGSGIVQSMQITLGRRSTVFAQDGFLLHDPAGALSVARTLDSRIRIRSASGRLIALDRMRMTDDVVAASTPGVTGAYHAFGTVWLLREMESDVYAQMRSALSLVSAGCDASYLAMTPLRDGRGAMIRIAATDGGDLDVALAAIREMWRLACRRDPCDRIDQGEGR